jgi:hypothetical protein
MCLAQWIRLAIIAAYRLERSNLRWWGTTLALPRLPGEALPAWRERMVRIIRRGLQLRREAAERCLGLARYAESCRGKGEK